MKPTPSRYELPAGLFVLAGLAAVAFLAFRLGASALLGTDTYVVQARFANLGGLNPGGSVMIAGVAVGRVDAVRLDPETYQAIAVIRLRQDLRLPVDSIASVKTTGLIGDKYLAIAPGGDARLLAPGDTLTETESAIDLESLISRFAFGSVTPDKSRNPQ